MKTNTLTALILMIGYTGVVKADTISLENATRLMLEFEPELNAAEYDTLSSIEDVKVKRSELLPQVGLRGSTGVSNRDRSTDGLSRSGDTLFQRQLGVSVRQLLYDGGVAKNSTLASQNAMRAQQYMEKAMVESRTVDLAETYMEILRSEKQIALARTNIDNHERMLSLIEKKVANGGHRTELGLIKSRLDRAKNSVANLKLAHEHSSTRFSRLIGRSDYVLTRPAIPNLPENLENISLENNWDYLAASEALEEAEHRAKAAKAEHAPKFYLDGGYTMGRDVTGISGQDNEVSALIVGQWQLFSGGRKKATERREHFQVGKFEELKRAADLMRNHDVSLLWQERQASVQSIDILGSYSEQLKSVVDDYEQRFTLGREELLNILDMQAEHYSVESDLVDSRFDFDTSAFRIMGKQGTLTEWLLRSEGDHGTQKRSLNSKNPIEEPIQVGLTVGEDLGDERIPRTQVELMKQVFDEDGPSAEYEPAPMEKYYKVETNSRKGIFGRPGIFKNNKKASQKEEIVEGSDGANPATATVTVKPLKKPGSSRRTESLSRSIMRRR